MNLSRLARIPARVIDDLKIVRVARNWKEILSVKRNQGQLHKIRLRNGVVLTAPAEVALNFLFHEIWIHEFYGPGGFEIRENETVVDIGANIGVFAMWAATRAPNVKVLAFEPFPENGDYFRANQMASGLGKIEFHQKAVAAHDGKRILKVNELWILHSLAEPGSTAKGLVVDCISLDNAIAELKSCDFLKLDCEGGEYEILYSASANTLAKIKRLVCEYNICDNELGNGQRLCDFLSEHGFVIDSQIQLDEASGVICARRENQG